MKELSPALAAELERSPAWMYDWNFGQGVDVPLLHHELPSVHRTKIELLESPLRAALAVAGPHARALDLACSEGFFAHRLLEWGAEAALGIDLRPENIRRAELVRDHFGVDPARLTFRQGDVFELDPRSLGTFDVVLLLGLIYHVEDPVGAARRAHALSRSVVAIETQLTRQDRPIEHGWGSSGSVLSAEASFAARLEPDSAANPIASKPAVLSLIPNLRALELIVSAAGFRELTLLEPAPHHNAQYRERDRVVAIARVDASRSSRGAASQAEIRPQSDPSSLR